MSDTLTELKTHGAELELLSAGAREVVVEELTILETIQARLKRDAAQGPEKLENLDAQMIELRDAISEAKEEDVASLIDQMHQVAALSRKRGQGRSIPIDPQSPYFGHLKLREAKSGRSRDVLVGRHTLLDNGDGLTIVDWRNAPVSRLYYRYGEGDEYEEDFDDRTIEGKVLVRRSLAISSTELRRVAAPQGTYARDGKGCWRETVGSAVPSLGGGSGTAARVDARQLGVHGDDADLRADKHLQEITALIDKEQFMLITSPDSGIVLIQGGAGSGKTTVALHRVAYLAFQDNQRFRTDKMLVVVYNDALVEYIRHVLPALGVAGVGVTTYKRWSEQLLAKLKLRVMLKRSPSTPDAVTKFKKHPMILKIIDQICEEQLGDVAKQLKERLKDRPQGQEIIEAWSKSSNLPPVIRVERLIASLTDGPLARIAPATKAPAMALLRSAKEQLSDVVSDWLELNSSAERIRSSVAQFAPNHFSDSEIETIIRWCARKAALEIDPDELLEEKDRLKDNGRNKDEDEDDDGEIEEDRSRVFDEHAGLDLEDDAILLRMTQVKFGGIFVAGRRFEYEHIVIDEAQDLCPLELRVLLDCVSSGHSVTIAGDRAQKMVFDNGFVDWPQLFGDAGLPHVAIQPLKITYRSTRQVMEFSRHVLGPLHDPDDELVARDGAPVVLFELSDTGEAVAFLGEALRGLMQREPAASCAIISRYPQQADVYYEALKIAEVPKLRRVRREDFSFTPGIDVTDVRQVKGLEFDYVVVIEPTRQNYPAETQARHLLHIAGTRAAHQLWLVCAGELSPLVPKSLCVDAPEPAS